MAGKPRHNISFAIEMALMAKSSFVALQRWAYAIARSLHDRHGKTHMRRGSSAQSDGTVLITSWCSANGTFANCWDPTKDITTKLARTFLSARMRQNRALFRQSATSYPSRISEDCT